jgi:hypothetical protein
MSQRLKRVRSDLDSDVQSVILGGNLSEIPGCFDFDDVDDDFLNVEWPDETSDKIDIREESPSSLEDYLKAGRICEELYGIDVLDLFTKLVLKGHLDPEEFVVQALAYKIQVLVRGSVGVR